MEFTKEFYKKLCNAIYDYAEKHDEVLDEYNMDLYMDGFVIYLVADFNVEWEDDSFDHAFGTQYYPPYAVLGNLTDISDVEIYDEETDERLDVDFNVDEFWSTFDVNEYMNLKKGDSVSFYRLKCKPDGTFLSYNTERMQYEVKTNDGHIRHVNNAYKVK